MGKEELKEHRSKEQTKAVVRAVKSKGNLTLAALLFSGISVISERTSVSRVVFRNFSNSVL